MMANNKLAPNIDNVLSDYVYAGRKLKEQRTNNMLNPQVQSALNYLKSVGSKFTSLDTPQDMSLGETLTDVGLGFVPGVGTAQGARDFERARRENDYLGMGLSAASMLPVVGGVVKAGEKIAGAEKAAEKIADLARETKLFGKGERTLPLKDYGEFSKFSRPLPEGSLFRETNAGSFLDLFKGDMPFSAPQHFFAEVPEMALGQGNNKGLMFEIDAHQIKGRPHLAKPGLDQSFLDRMGEFEVTAQPSELAKRIKTIYVSPEATKNLRPVERKLLNIKLEQLKNSGVNVHHVDVLPGRE